MSSSNPPGKLYSANELCSFVTALFEKVGVSREDASLAANSLVEADLRGVETHGVSVWLTMYVRRIQAGVMEARPNMVVKRERPSVALLDGGNGLGQLVAHRAMTIAIQKAAITGAAFVGVTNSNHFGTCAYWSMMALRNDQIGFAMTNGRALMAPWGGRKPMLNTSPISVAIPGYREGSVVLDMATTATTKARIQFYDKRGLRLESGWAFDSAGCPTTDPKEALRGLLAPVGGYKGYGLALMVELLSGILTGGKLGYYLGPVDDYSRPSEVGSFFGAMAIDAFMDPAEFKARVEKVIREIRESPKAEGFQRIYIPGEIEAECMARRLEEGIPLSQDVVQKLTAMGEELGVPFPS